MAPSKAWMTAAALSPTAAGGPATSSTVTTARRAGTPEGGKEHLQDGGLAVQEGLSSPPSSPQLPRCWEAAQRSSATPPEEILFSAGEARG